MARGLAHTTKVRSTASAKQFMDVQFIDTVRKPMDVVKQVYDFIGWELTPDVQGRMRAWLIEDEKSHSAAHDYSADTFGLSEAQIERDFAAYRQRHILSANNT